MKLDTKRRSTMLALASPSRIHGAIESSFPGERTRRLWRIDSLQGETYLLLLSEETVDLSNVYDQFGSVLSNHNDDMWETRSYTPLLERIEEGTRWHFRLVACPVSSISSLRKEGETRGKVTAHVTVSQQKEWLLARAEKNGFSLGKDDFEVVHRETKRFKKGSNKNTVTLCAATYEGILTVMDKEKFCHLLTNGIGKGKAYGLGMMTVIRNG